MPSVDVLIRAYNRIADGWVRLDHASIKGARIRLLFAIAHGKRGRVISRYMVLADGTHEVRLSDFNGGGMRLYPSSHPAAKQYVDVKQRLSVSGAADSPCAVVGALLDAHTRTVDDWIPFDRYLGGAADSLIARLTAARIWIFAAPRFLCRVYAATLKAKGISVRVLSGPSMSPSSNRPRVLHFGESYVVADRFKSENV